MCVRVLCAVYTLLHVCSTYNHDVENPIPHDATLYTTRLKATLERVQFLTQSYSDWELNIFSDRALKLGTALGLPRERIMVGAWLCYVHHVDHVFLYMYIHSIVCTRIHIPKVHILVSYSLYSTVSSTNPTNPRPSPLCF